ncbi:MAG TPA: SRPBCC domain-containing protein [Hanamia sp.]
MATRWKPGSELLWKGNYEGKDMVFVKGKIIEIIPEKFLSYTTIDPNSGIADIPANYLTVTYDLKEENGQTELTATQGDYSTVGDGEKRFRETLDGGGWNPILIQIKKMLES